MRSHNLIFSVVYLVVAMAICPICEAQSGDYIFHFDTSDTGPSGSSVNVRTLLDNPGGNLAGWSLAVCHDIDQVEVINLVNGNAPLTANAGGPADFVESTIFPGEGLRQGVVIHFVGLNELPSDADHEVIIIEYTLIGADDTFAQIQFCNITFTGDTSASETLVVAPGGIAIIPDLVDGEIEIGGLPPFALYCEASEASVEQGNPVDASIIVDAPVPSYGFSLGLAHSGAALFLSSAEAGPALTALNGGDGPDFLTIDIDPEGADGLIVACLVSLGSELNTLPAGDGQVLAIGHYQALSTAPLGVTTLEFSESLVPQSPSPPTAIIFSLGSTSAVVNTSNASIEIIEGVVGVQFTRGDYDGDGAVNLADPINLLQYMFNGGPAPSCEKIGDMDDDGSIALGDPIVLLSYLFSGGPAPAEPFENCGIDPTEDTLTCESFNGCP